jgi:hypothetical protein
LGIQDAEDVALLDAGAFFDQLEDLRAVAGLVVDFEEVDGLELAVLVDGDFEVDDGGALEGAGGEGRAVVAVADEGNGGDGAGGREGGEPDNRAAGERGGGRGVSHSRTVGR